MVLHQRVCAAHLFPKTHCWQGSDVIRLLFYRLLAGWTFFPVGRQEALPVEGVRVVSSPAQLLWVQASVPAVLVQVVLFPALVLPVLLQAGALPEVSALQVYPVQAATWFQEVLVFACELLLLVL
jgi:hypothetical protein